MSLKLHKHFTLYCLMATAFLLVYMGGTIVAENDIGIISVLFISGFTAFSLMLWHGYERQMEKEMKELRFKMILMKDAVKRYGDVDKEIQRKLINKEINDKLFDCPIQDCDYKTENRNFMRIHIKGEHPDIYCMSFRMEEYK